MNWWFVARLAVCLAVAAQAGCQRPGPAAARPGRPGARPAPPEVRPERPGVGLAPASQQPDARQETPARPPEAPARAASAARSSEAVAPPAARQATAAARESAETVPPGGKVYYVEPPPAGSDANDGLSPRTPFATIQRAAGVMIAGDVCRISAGTYRETVRPANSGMEGMPLVFEARDGGEVIVSGADPVTGWTREPDGTWRASMPADFFKSSINQSDQVFVDGKMMILARWPNTSLDVSNPAKATMSKFVSKTRDASTNLTTAVFEDDELAPQTDGYYVGAEIFVQPNYRGWSWAFTGRVIDQKGKRLTIQSRNDSGKDGKPHVYDDRSRYYLFGLRKLLDSDGEWYHDRGAGVLYLRPPGGRDPNRCLVEAKRRDFGFDLTGKSHVVIRGLRLFACTITTDNASGGDCVAHDERGNVRYPWRPKGTKAPSAHVTIERLKAEYLNHFTDCSGHFFLQWGQATGIVLSGSDHVLRDSVIRYSAGNGVTLLGERHKVINNVIADVNYAAVDCSAIYAGGAAEAVDCEIAHNTIARCGRSGITPRNLRNSRPGVFAARIHHNDVGYCMLQDWDGGCIYWAGSDSGWLRIDHNFCHDSQGFINAGIYPDYSKNIIIDHNVIWNCEWGIHIQGVYNPAGAATGTGGERVNNTLVYNNTIACLDTSKTGWGPFCIGGGANDNATSVLANNICYLLDSASTKKYVSPYNDGMARAKKLTNLDWDRRPGSQTDPLFVDASRFDFRLRKGSPAIDAGTVLGPFRYEGLEIPAFADPAVGPPDIGAYEFGAEAWRAGSSLPEAAEASRPYPPAASDAK